MLAGVLFMEDEMQPDDYATKEDVARVETRLAALEGLLNEALSLLRGKTGMVAPSPPVKRQVDPDYLPGGVQWMIMATDEERRAYNRAVMKKRRGGKR